MFGNNKKASEDRSNNRRDSVNALNLIGQGTKITGNMTCQGDVRIDGELTGNITAYARIVLGPTGVVFGDIVCENADISGKIEGTIRVKELLNLKESALINGDLTANKLVVEAGAIFNGRCTMGNSENFSFESSQAEIAAFANPARSANASKSIKTE
ncbi:MAG: polymer-forming cytoskeletal protein [Sphingobacteriales bacterium]|nr:MAG: polymer-forming cytoskeletal protein [Sphingobacteriales bacterium]